MSFLLSISLSKGFRLVSPQMLMEAIDYSSHACEEFLSLILYEFLTLSKASLLL